MKKENQKVLLIGGGLLAFFLVTRKAKGKPVPAFLPNNKKKGLTPELIGYFVETENLYSLPVRLLSSIAKQESNFDQSAIGKDGEEGLMQIYPRWHPEIFYNGQNSNLTKRLLGQKIELNFFDPEISIEYAGWYLRWLMNTLKNFEHANELPLGSVANWGVVMIAYNWGIGNLLNMFRGSGATIPKATMIYADKIMTNSGLPLVRIDWGILGMVEQKVR